MLFRKYILSILFYLILFKLSAQKQQNFDILNVKTDRTYMNLIQYNDKLYIGSNGGAIIINSKSQEENILSDQKGYIMVENNKITGNKISAEYNPNDNQYNQLLPEKYRHTTSRSTIYNNRLYIINNGILFIFKQNSYSTTYDSLSVRSITNNYIGSYQGIFKKGVKLKFPEFTDGNIREFDNETIICYGGLYRDSNGKVTIYNNLKNGEVAIAGQELGSARDILKLENGNYALVTNTGIYVVNFSKNIVNPVIKSKTKNEYLGIYQLVKNKSENDRFYYSENDKIYSYVIATNDKVLILDTKKNSTIKDIYAINLSNIYVLFEDKLCKYTNNGKTTVLEETVYIDDINFTHNLIKLNDKIFVTSNVGAHVYDLKTNKAYLNIIPFEINRRSLALINDTIKFGTPSGIVSLSEEDINNIIKDKDNLPISNISSNTDLKSYIIYLLLIAIFILLLIGYKIKKRTPSKEISVVNDNIMTKENIVEFIYANITSVTIQGICDKFGITPVRLYEILEHDKPGEIIRNHRINLVRRYRREKKDDEFIAKNTGFSISYLKKIY